MSCTKNMLSVIMDGLKDAEMMVAYADESERNGHHEWSTWFRNKAKQRYDILQQDYSYVMRSINMEGRQDDEIAMALKEYLEQQMDKVRMMVL